MKSLERRFNRIYKNDPGKSSLVCFVEAVYQQKFNRQTVHRWFHRLVDKEDYDKKALKEVFTYIERINNCSDDNKKSTQTALYSVVNN